MLSEDYVIALVDRMANHARGEYDALVRLESIDFEQESFIVETRSDRRVDEKEDPWHQYKWLCLEAQYDDKTLICLEVKNVEGGWVMQAIPALMFAAIYAG